MRSRENEHGGGMAASENETANENDIMSKMVTKHREK